MRKRIIHRNYKTVGLVFALVLIAGLALIGFRFITSSSDTESEPPISVDKTKEDLKYVSGGALSFQQLSDFFKKIAVENGAEYAFDILRKANLQPDVDIHLLGHTIGDELYKQKGVEGIKICTQEFRNACSHTIVIGLFQERGAEALDEIAQTCRTAPGGKGAYTMCFHGLGHGILAYNGYDMKKTSEYCGMTSTEEYQNQEGIECMGGAVMEIIGGGGHDKEQWEKMRAEYLKADEPLGLCTSEIISDEVRPMCVVYITPYLFEATGGSIGSKNHEDIKKAFATCKTLTGEYSFLQNLCYGSFGKEFPSIANNLDTREIWKISDEGLGKIYEWCKLSDNQEGTEHCIRNAVQSLFWGGENQVSGAVRFCNSISTQRDQTACLQELIGASGFYLKPEDPKRKEICDTVIESEQEKCKAHLVVSS